jgi:hypothetical protein
MTKRERPDLELDFDDAFQRREHRVQRAGWAVIALVLVAALAGATGDGPLANARLERGGVEVVWARIVRAKARTEVRVEAQAALARDGYLTVRLGKSWIEAVEIEEVRPEPARVSAVDDFVEYRFAVAPAATTTTATFIVRPETIGRSELVIAAADAPTFSVRQFVLP